MRKKKPKTEQRSGNDASRLKKTRSRSPAGTKSAVQSVGRRRKGVRATALDALIEVFPDFAMVADGEGRLLSCNRQVTNRLVRKGGCRRSTVFDVFPHLTPAYWRDTVCRGRSRQKGLRVEGESEGRYFLHHFHALPDERGNIDSIVIFARDISEFRNAENALLASERKYRELLENISDSIFTLNEEGAVIYVNPAIEAFLGFSQEEVRGKAFTEFLHPAETAPASGDLEVFLSGGLPQREFRFLHKDGSARWGRVSSRRVVFKDEVIGYQGIISDITQTKTLDVKLLKIVQENILSSLAAAFSAEIAVPLTRARERLLSHWSPAKDDSEINASLRALMHDLEGISLYLKHLAAFTGTPAGSTRSLDVNALAESALSLLGQQFSSAGIEIVSNFARDLEPVSVDSFSLVQSLVNVFNYSLHSCREGGNAASPKKLTLDTRMEKDRVIIEVLDTGPGIPYELRKRLAEPSSSLGMGRNAAVGLAIARQLVDSQGGVFELVEDDSAAGAHVKISIPSVIQVI